MAKMAGNTRPSAMLAPSPQQHPQEHKGHINMAMGQPSVCGNEPHTQHRESLQAALPKPCPKPAQDVWEGASLAQVAPKVPVITPQTHLRWAPLLIQNKGQQINDGLSYVDKHLNLSASALKGQQDAARERGIPS